MRDGKARVDESSAHRFVAALIVLALGAGGAASCGSLSSTLEPPATFTSSPTFTPSPTSVHGVSFTPPPTRSPTPSPTPTVIILAQNLHAPDDMALAPDGAIYFSDPVDDTVSRLDSDGQVTTVLANLAEPEGLVLLPGGSIVVVEQSKNRLTQFDLTTRASLPFLQLRNATSHPGVDNVLLDPNSQTLIVPDSPNGTLLRVGLIGQILQTLAAGLARPAGVAVEADGSLLVVEEKENAIVRIPAQGGSPQVVAQIPTPDDVVADARGNIYAISTVGNALYHIDAATGVTKRLLKGLAGPQGIIFDADGNLVITDPGHGRIIKVVLP